MAAWYVRRGEKVVGPIEVAKLKELAAADKLLPTDQLAKDAAGPWKRASQTSLFSPEPPPAPPATPTPPPRAAITRTVEPPPVQSLPNERNSAKVVEVSRSFMAGVRGSFVAISSAVGRSLSTRARRKHELKLAKLQAKALTDSQRPLAEAPQQGFQAASPTAAPQVVQTTVVKVVNRSDGCGCSGCSVILLLILIGIIAIVISSHPSLSPDASISPTSPTSRFPRAAEVVRVFLRDTDFRLSKSQEYDNNIGGKTVKGACAANGGTYLWTVAFDASGNVALFNFDTVTFLAEQPAGHLSYLPENEQYITNEAIRMPTLEGLRAIGIDAKEGY